MSTRSDNPSRRQTLYGLGTAGLALTAATTAQAQGTTNAGRPLAGKVAIVTGARNNQGRAYAAALAGLGVNVVIHYHRVETRNEAADTAGLVEKAGAKAILIQGDLTNSENVKKLFDAAQTTFGGTDIVVHTVGAIIKKPLAQFTDAEFERLDAINNRALFYTMREAANRVRNGGRIIAIGTSLTAGSAPGYAVYAGTKAPVEEYTRMLARELGEKRITVNAIAPGPLDNTFFHAAETPQSTAFAASLSVERRLGKIEDIVPLVEFLAQPPSQWVNGQTLWINGGYLTR
jgi:NAD(P)-dependent dehydrogenase (short-subunit alcohol dehydrogenase family)